MPIFLQHYFSKYRLYLTAQCLTRQKKRKHKSELCCYFILNTASEQIKGTKSREKGIGELLAIFRVYALKLWFLFFFPEAAFIQKSPGIEKTTKYARLWAFEPRKLCTRNSIWSYMWLCGLGRKVVSEWLEVDWTWRRWKIISSNVRFAQVHDKQKPYRQKNF